MSIRERKWKSGGVEKTAWVVDYIDQGGKRHLKTFRLKRDAKAFEASTAVEVAGRVHVADRETVTVTEAAKLWLAACDESGLERTTIAQYRQHVDLHILPFIGSTRLNEVTIPQIRAFMDKLRAEGRSDAMLRNVRVSLGSILSDAQERGLVVRNAVKDMGRSKAKAKVAARHESPPEVGIDIPLAFEIKALLAASKGKARVFLMTAIFTGMRASELRGLRWSDISFDKAEIRVRQRADATLEIGSPKSKKGQRTIPIVTPLVDALKLWKEECPKGSADLVFPNGAGNVEYHANIIKRVLHPTMIAAGLTLESGEPKYSGLHSLRHFYASWCINRKQDGGLELPAKLVQERMGHSSIQVTLNTYSHLFPRDAAGDTMDEAAQALVG